MQNLTFTRFGVNRGQEGAANLGAADFTTASNSSKMGFSRLGHSVSGLVRGLRTSSLSLSLSLVACLGLFSPVFATDTTNDGQTFDTATTTDALNVIHKNISITAGTFTGATTIDASGSVSGISGATVVKLTNNGSIDTISGNYFNNLTNKGTITTISGGNFVKKGDTGAPSEIISTSVLFHNEGHIETISDINFVSTGTFNNRAASSSQSAGSIGKITGGTFQNFNNYNTIGTISGGTFNNSFKNGSGANTPRIDAITGGTFNKTFENAKGATIGEISGGTFTTLKNVLHTRSQDGAGVIEKISGNASIGELINEKYGEIKEIAGGAITTKFTNSGTVGDISGNVNIADLTNLSTGTVTISGTVKGKMTNQGTVTFMMKNDSLGKLDGDFTNEGNGKVKVNVQGATMGGEYTFITGNATGLDAEGVFELLSPNASYITATYSLENKSVTLTASQKFEDDFGKNSNQGSNIEAIAKKLATSNADIANTSAVADADSSIKESYVSNPKAILSSFKAGAAAATPLGMGTISAGIAPNGYKADLMSKAFNKKSKLLASTDLVMTDGIEPLNPFEDESLTELFVTPFGGGLTGNGVSGFMAGVNLGLVKATNDYALQGVLSYAYGDTKQDLSTQNTDTTGHIFGVGFVAQFYLENLIGASMVEADIHANFTLGKFKLENAWLADSSLNSSSDFTNYQGNIGAQIGPRYSYLNDKLSTKIFVGLQNYYESQGSFSVLDLKSDSYNDYTLNGVAGLEERIMLGESAFIFGRAGYEFRLYNSTKEVFMRDSANELKYENASNKGILTANIGGQIHAADSLKLGIEGIYKHYNTGLNYFGGSVNVRFVF